MKVKIFTESYSNDSVEEKINKWLDKENPDIKFIKQSGNYSGIHFNYSFS